MDKANCDKETKLHNGGPHNHVRQKLRKKKKYTSKDYRHYVMNHLLTCQDHRSLLGRDHLQDHY